MRERAVVQDLVALVIHGPRRRQPHIVLNARIVNQVWIIVEDYRSRDVIQLLVSLLVLAFLVVANGCQRASMADDLGNAALLGQVSTLRLLSQELVLLLEPRHLEKGLAVVADDVITDFDLLGKLRVLDTNPVVATNLLLLAVEEKLLASLNLDRRFTPFNISKADPRSLQVNVYSALLPRDFGSFADHLDENFVLFVLYLRRVDPANVHALLEQLDNGRLEGEKKGQVSGEGHDIS